jgi:hypothetical protein
VSYLHRLHDDVLGWYRSAESKAQVIVTLNGVFLTVLMGFVLARQADLATALGVFGIDTWALLFIVLGSVLVSVTCAVLALASRTYRKSELVRVFEQLGVDPARVETYGPGVLWFFQHVAALERQQFADRMIGLSAEDEIRILASQVHILSGNVAKKHAWANRAFLGAATALLALLGLAVDYILRVQATLV